MRPRSRAPGRTGGPSGRGRRSHGDIATTSLLALVTATCGPGLAFGGGAGVMSLEVGGETTVSPTPVLAARLFVPDSSGGALVVDLQPIPVRNPVADESVSTLYLLPSLQVAVGPAFLRAGAGPILSIWSGPSANETFGYGLGAGAELELPVPGPRGWSVALFGRAGGGIEVSGALAGVLLVWYPTRR